MQKIADQKCDQCGSRNGQQPGPDDPVSNSPPYGGQLRGGADADDRARDGMRRGNRDSRGRCHPGATSPPTNVWDTLMGNPNREKAKQYADDEAFLFLKLIVNLAGFFRWTRVKVSTFKFGFVFITATILKSIDIGKIELRSARLMTRLTAVNLGWRSIY